MVYFRHYNYKILLGIPILILGISCAYFNTFYNAQKYFAVAESEIEKAEDPEKLSKQTMETLKKTIEKCKLIIKNYPESKLIDDALLIMGKAQYYRQEYRNAKETLEKLIRESISSPLENEARLWILKSKWKLEGRESVKRDIKKFIIVNEKVRRNRDLIRIAKETLAEIYLESGILDSAIILYSETADLQQNNNMKARLYFKIAELSQKRDKLGTAKKFYRKVIKVSENRKDIEKSRLQIIKILRQQNKWDETISEIQSLISNDKFIDIRAQLYLELGILYDARSMVSEAVNRYKLVTEEFAKSESSAEAYFHLGTISIREFQDYEQSKKYFENVPKEKRNSMFAPSAKLRIKEINALLTAKEKIEELESTLKSVRESIAVNNLQVNIDISDTTKPDTSTIAAEIDTSQIIDTLSIRNELGEKLYSYGELLAFHFDQPSSGIIYFKQLVKKLDEHPRTPQALYSLIYLNRLIGDSSGAIEFSNKLLTDFSISEYAQKISSENGKTMKDDALSILWEAEQSMITDHILAINYYKKLVKDFPTSIFIPNALYAIAHIYDFQENNLDSALVAYQNLLTQYPVSDQAISVENRYQTLLTLKTSTQDSTTIDTTESYEN